MKRLTLFATVLVLLAPIAVRAQQSKPASAVAADAASVGAQAQLAEERLIDLQVQIATLRSLVANTAAVATAGGASQERADPFRAPLDARQQIAALERRVESLSSKVRQLTGKPSSIMPAATSAVKPRYGDEQAQGALQQRAGGQTWGSQTSGGQISGGQTLGAHTPGGQVPGGRVPGGQGAGGWAGSTTIVPGTAGQGVASQIERGTLGQSDGVTRGELLPGQAYPRRSTANLSNDAAGGWPASSQHQRPVQSTTQAGGEIRAAYDTAYQYLLQQDYGAAQVAFREFVSKHPKSKLAGNAQYWIGETHFVRGAYKEAAVAFLKSYENYGDGIKAPDSLLKLALSLGKLRQTEAACSSLSEIGERYADAPGGVHARAKQEQRRLRCSK